jgi:hypothetical protein
VSGRGERVARNEAASRDLNERLEEAHDGEPRDQQIRMFCECGREECDRLVAITIPEYEELRSDSRQFVVVMDHVMGDVERVVSRTDRFVVVAKLEGTPAAVVTEEDPRA